MTETEQEHRLFVEDVIADLDSYTHTCLTESNFPRTQRYVLCNEISRLMSEIFTNAVKLKKRYYTKTTLQQIDVNLDILRYKIRESHRKGYIKIERRQKWMRKVDEAGRMVGTMLEKQRHGERQQEK